MESKMEFILASVFNAFQWILWAKVGAKIDQKSIQKAVGKGHWFFIDFWCVLESGGGGDPVGRHGPGLTGDSLSPPPKGHFFQRKQLNHLLLTTNLYLLTTNH